MHKEQQLIAKLDQQLSKLEQLIIDMQKDEGLQQIFFRKKLYLNLNNMFNFNYFEYTKYFEEIIADYKNFKKNHDELFKIYFLNKVESKIFALFKTLRSLKKYKVTNDSITEKIIRNQEKINTLTNEKQMLEKMSGYLETSYHNLHRQLMNGQANQDLNNKLLALLAKKGRVERELFSVTERLKLL